jgi:hypothetical protein
MSGKLSACRGFPQLNFAGSNDKLEFVEHCWRLEIYEAFIKSATMEVKQPPFFRKGANYDELRFNP